MSTQWKKFNSSCPLYILHEQKLCCLYRTLIIDDNAFPFFTIWYFYQMCRWSEYSVCVAVGGWRSHANSNLIQQHLLKPDPQLLSQVKDGLRVLTTMAEASPWLILTWPPSNQSVHLDPGPEWYTALWKRGSVCDMMQSPSISLHGKCFTSWLKPPLTICADSSM